MGNTQRASRQHTDTTAPTSAQTSRAYALGQWLAQARDGLDNAPNRLRQWWETTSLLGVLLTCGLCLVVVLFTVATVLFPAARGLTPVVMRTSTMSAAVPQGSLAYMRPTTDLSAYNAVAPGDVIAAHTGEGVTITRVIARSGQGLTRQLTTRDDASTKANPTPVTLKTMRGQIAYFIPFLGYVTAPVGGDPARLLGLLLGLAIIGFVARRWWRSRNADTPAARPTNPRHDPVALPRNEPVTSSNVILFADPTTPEEATMGRHSYDHVPLRPDAVPPGAAPQAGRPMAVADWQAHQYAQEQYAQQQYAQEQYAQQQYTQEQYAQLQYAQEAQRQAAASQAAAERAEYERAEYARAEYERSEYERAERLRAEQDRREFERATAERAEYERRAFERAEYERAEHERREHERREYERAEHERAEYERARREQHEYDRGPASGALPLYAGYENVVMPVAKPGYDHLPYDAHAFPPPEYGGHTPTSYAQQPPSVRPIPIPPRPGPAATAGPDAYTSRSGRGPIPVPAPSQPASGIGPTTAAHRPDPYSRPLAPEPQRPEASWHVETTTAHPSESLPIVVGEHHTWSYPQVPQRRETVAANARRAEHRSQGSPRHDGAEGYLHDDWNPPSSSWPTTPAPSTQGYPHPEYALEGSGVEPSDQGQDVRWDTPAGSSLNPQPRRLNPPRLQDGSGVDPTLVADINTPPRTGGISRRDRPRADWWESTMDDLKRGVQSYDDQR